MGKEAFRRVAVCKGLNKAMPLIHPIVAVAAATLGMPLLTGDREITHILPSQGMTQGLPDVSCHDQQFWPMCFRHSREYSWNCIVGQL